MWYIEITKNTLIKTIVKKFNKEYCNLKYFSKLYFLCMINIDIEMIMVHGF